MYNGYDAALVTSSGAAKNSIDKTNSKLAGRGVLLDVARHKGVRAPRAGLRHHRRRILEATGPPPSASRCSPGTSSSSAPATWRATSTRATGGTTTSTPPPASSVHTAPWLHAGQIAAIACDKLRGRGSPLGDPGLPQSLPRWSPFQTWGLTLGEIFFLEGAGRRLRVGWARYAFLLVAPPLAVHAWRGGRRSILTR